MFENLKDFIETTPNAMFCVENITDMLQNKGYVLFRECDTWERPKEDVAGIIIVRDSSIIAVRLPNKFTKFTGVLTHSDSPCFRIKRNPDILSNGYTKLNVEPYGGAIYYSWLDKPLSICGKLIVNKDFYLIDTFEEHQVIIPSQAIHINREVNSVNNLNPQVDMCPIFSIRDEDEKNFEKFIKQKCEIENDELYSMDLYLYNPEPVKRINLAGNDYQSLIVGPRLDNLTSVWAALDAFINAPEVDGSAQVFAAFDSEEIGSTTHSGANSNFLTTVLERLCLLYGVDKYATLARSLMLSVDAAHAIHPNASGKSDPSNFVKLGSGIVIKHNDNYAQDVGIEYVIREICSWLEINCQEFYSRSDMRCGSTLGNISMVHHGIRTLDIGIPMLAMHSSVETISEKDILNLREVISMFYSNDYEMR